MKTKLIAAFASTLLMAAVATANAQSASCAPAANASCQPSACGPGNTKGGEAKSIQQLRTDLEKTASLLAGKSQYGLDPAKVKPAIPQGSNDDESIDILAGYVTALRQEVLSKIPANLLLKELKEYEQPRTINKARFVAAIKKEVNMLKKQAEVL